MTAAVFFHSTGTPPTLWSAVAAAAGIPADRAIHVAHLGYPPAAPFAHGTELVLADELAHAERQLRGEAFDLVAHSYGGLVALALAPRIADRVRSVFLYEPVLFGTIPDHPDVTALLAHPTFTRDPGGGDADDTWLAQFVDFWNRPGSWARMPPAMQAWTRAVRWKMFQEVRQCFFAAQRLDQPLLAQVPTTLAMGSRSPAAARAVVTGLAAHQPAARVVELDGVGHMAPLTHPAIVGAALRDHLARLDARPGPAG